MNVLLRSLLTAACLFASLALTFNLALAQGSGLVISDDTLSFDRVRGGEFGEVTLTLTNTTSATISGTVGEPSGVFRVVSGGGDFSLDASDTMTVTLRFTPSAVLDFTDSLTIDYTIGDSLYTAIVLLVGAGVTPGPVTIDVAPDVLLFGTVAIGDTASATLRIINTSDSARVHATVEAMAGPFYTDGEADVNISLAAGDTEEVTIRFVPTAAILYNDSLTITYGWGDSTNTMTVGLIGTGSVALADTVDFTVTPAQLNFGGVRIGTSQTRSIYITNTSDSAQFAGTIVSVGGAFTVMAGAGPFSLGAGETREITIRFAPTSVSLQRDSLMVIYLNGLLGLDTAYVEVSGWGTETVSPVASVLVQPEVVLFGNVRVGQSGQRTITILNTSDTAVVSGTVMASTPGSAFVVTSGSGAFTLEAGESHSFVVQFSPTATGAFSDSLLVVYDASSLIQPTMVYFAGAGVQASGGLTLSVQPGAVNFGTVNVGATYQSEFQITNSSATDTIRGMIINPAAPFFINGSAGLFVLAPGETQNVTVYFTPVLPGTFSDNIVISYVTGDTAGTVVVALTGTANIIITGVREEAIAASMRVTNFPEPTNGTVTIRYVAPEGGHVRVSVFDPTGREVERLVDDVVGQGEQTATWSAHGHAAGVYLLRVQTESGIGTSRITVMR